MDVDAAGLRVFSRGELREYDGHRRPAYVAFGGRVFDVSASGQWRGGLHRALHWAGQDLTDELPDAPHGVENLERFPVVGRLAAPPDA